MIDRLTRLLDVSFGFGGLHVHSWRFYVPKAGDPGLCMRCDRCGKWFCENPDGDDPGGYDFRGLGQSKDITPSAEGA